MHILVLSVVAMALFGSFVVIDSFAMPLDSGMVAGVSWKNWASVAASSVKQYMAHAVPLAGLDKFSCSSKSDVNTIIGDYTGAVKLEELAVKGKINPEELLYRLDDGDSHMSIMKISEAWDRLVDCGVDPMKEAYISPKLSYGIHQLAYKFPNISKDLLERTASGARQAEEFFGIAPSKGYVIPEWVKNNAGWWSEGKITDQDFTSGLQYLIKEKIIKVPASNSDKSGSSEIPKWVKNVAKFWADGKTTAADFVNGIQYLITNNIIHVS